MHRRHLLCAVALFPLPPAYAHHGWSGFDQTRPIYVEGRASSVAWRNPHAEVELELPSNMTLPPDLTSRELPAQTAPVDGPALLKAARLPTRHDRRWHIELAPIARLQAWNVPQIKTGEALGVLGYAAAGEKGDAVLRAEYLFVGGKVYGLRSSPA